MVRVSDVTGLEHIYATFPPRSSGGYITLPSLFYSKTNYAPSKILNL